MLAPQSADEVQPVVEALRRLDPLLDIRWNPKAVMVAKGHYDVLGGRTDPTYDGRWEVVRYQTATKLHDDRDYTLICRVTELRREDGVPVMLADGAYAPIGFWLVDYMQLWDRAQSAWQSAMDRLWEEHEQAETVQHEDYRAAHQEAAEKVYSEHAGPYWMGGAQGKAAPETVRTLFGGIRGAVASLVDRITSP